MADYLLGDMPIASAVPLPLLLVPTASTSAHVLTVTRNQRNLRPPAIGAWHHQWRDDTGRPVIGLALTPSGYLLRFPHQCDFTISADARRIDARPHRRLAPATLEHLLADQVVPRCLAHRGELLVHAAGIAFGRDIALFVGESGRGKSTLAGLFLRAGRTVLTDDCLMLRPTAEAVRAVPSYPSLRLSPDSVAALFPGDSASETAQSHSEKQRFPVPDASRQTVAGRVAALYFIGEANAAAADVTVEPLAAASSCIRLMEQSFQLDVMDRDAVKRLLARAGEVVMRVPSFTLDFPRDFRRVADLRGSIEGQFTSVAGVSSVA